MLARMQAELNLQEKSSQFRIPDYADQPASGDQSAAKQPGKKKKKQALPE